MELISARVETLRNKLSVLKSNKEKLVFLKDYYKNKTAVIIATGPGFQDHIDTIKKNINDNTIIMCIKQSLKSMNHIADFHILNHDHYEEYEYVNTKPIILFINYIAGRKIFNDSDINFFLDNMQNVYHWRKNVWDEIDNNKCCLLMNDDNLGPGENMVVNKGHIMMELVFPLCVHLGIKNIVLNGFVGGSSHGINVKNEVNWDDSKFLHLYAEETKNIKISEKIPTYMKDNYDINVVTLCNSRYKIDKINYDDYIKMIR